MKNENGGEPLPVMKKNLPEVMYPGVPIAGADSEAPAVEPAEEAAADEPAAGVDSEAPPTPEEQKRETDELAKSKAGAVIYTVAFIINIIMCFENFRPMFAVADEHGYFRALFAIILSIPTISSVPAAIFTRLIVNYPVRKGLNFYMGAISFVHVILLGGMKPWGAQFLLFVLGLIFCVAVTCEILGYKKGEPFHFIKSAAKLLMEKHGRRK